MKTRWLLFCLPFFVLLSCQDKEDDLPQVTPTPTPTPSTNTLNLSDLQVGQKSIYRHYRATCDDLENTFEYTGDSIVVEVIAIDNQLHFDEYFTAGSVNQDTTHRQVPVTSKDQLLLLPERNQSALFFFYGSDTIHLAPAIREDLEQASCRVIQSGSPFIGNDIGHIPSFELEDIKHYDKTIVSCVPMILNMEAYLLYDQEQLHLTYTLQGFEFMGVITEHIEGWELVKE